MTNDQKFKLCLALINQGMPVLRTLSLWGSVVLIVYLLTRAAASFAGQQTTATFIFQLIASIQLDRWAAYAVALIATMYGLRQRQLRQKAIARLSSRPAELEKLLDADRSSSGLPVTGATRKEDR